MYLSTEVTVLIDVNGFQMSIVIELDSDRP